MTAETTPLYRKLIIHPLLLAAVALMVTCALYISTVDYTLFNDDPVYVRIVDDVSLGQLFFARTSNPYYRPMNFAPLEIVQMISGRVHAAPLHWLGLLTYALNGWLLALITRRMFPAKVLLPLVVILLYLTFPFSYQAVPYVAAMGHIQAATGILLAVLFVDRWLESRKWWDLVGMAVGVFIANWAQENGIITGTILAVWLFIRHYDFSFNKLRTDWRTAAIPLGIAFALHIIYLIMWQFLSNHPETSRDIPSSLPGNLLYYAQGLAYPITQFGYQVSTVTGWSNFAVVGVLSAVGIVILVVGVWLFGDRRAWFGVAYFLIGIIIPAALLDYTYTLTAPHLLMIIAPAIALLWGIAAAGLWDKAHLLKIPAVIVLALAIGGGAIFVQDRLEVQAKFERLYRAIYAEIEENGNAVVFFNIPEWITPKERHFMLDESGIVYKPRYLPFEELVWANTGIEYETAPILWHDNIPLHDAYWMEYVNEYQPGLEERLVAVRSAARFYRVKALPTEFVLEEAHPINEVGDLNLSNGVYLAVSAERANDKTVQIVIDLQTINGQVAEKIFVHLLCGDQIVAQSDGALMGEIYPYDYWSAGEAWREVRVLEVPAGTPADCLAVRIGMFNPVTGERPKLEDGSEWVVIPVERRIFSCFPMATCTDK